MKTSPISALALVAVTGLAGARVAAAGDSKSKKDETTCIERREINAITALDERHALARLSAGRFYLLTIQERCLGFEDARRVVLDATRTRVCGDGTSLLAFDAPAVGPLRCRIERIDSVKHKGAALELIEERAREE